MTELQTALGQSIGNDIDNLITKINGLEDTTINYLGKIDNIQEYAKNKAQEKVDEMCERISNEINSKLNTQISMAVSKIEEIYNSSTAFKELITSIATADVEHFTKISEIVEFLTTIQKLFSGPYNQMTNIIADFIIISSKLTNLITKINEILSIRNSIPQHILKDGTQLNYDKLNINVDTTSITALQNIINPQQS